MRDYLKDFRKKNNITQDEFAKQLCVSRTYYSRIESGQRCKKLNLSLVQKISRILAVSMDYIVEQESQILKKS